MSKHVPEYYFDRENNTQSGEFLPKLKARYLSDDVFAQMHSSTVRSCHDVFIEYGEDDERGILMIHRRQQPVADMLWPIGGGIVRGMETEESLKTIVKKECGLALNDITLLGTARVFLEDDAFGHGKGYDALALVYYAKGSGALKLNEHHYDPVIMTPEKYASYRENAPPYIRDFMDRAMDLVSRD